ncbi:hypothetical protein BDL97_09G020200 [Sphagnum fallax]|nr:hypothetical protein BDL97_09G020200 [Sphagnum fallax]
MNSTLNASRKRLLPKNDDESRVAKHGKFEELELAKARVELQLRNIDFNRLQQLGILGAMYELCSSIRASPC